MLETDRLLLQPYSPDQLLTLIEEPERFEAVAGVPAADGLRAFLVSDEVSPEWLDQLRSSDAADLWVHGFAVVHRQKRCAIGTAGFKGPPDANGMVEIAYGIVPEFEGQGFATEAAGALVAFAFSNDTVDVVRAHTLPENNGSTRVLSKCGFEYLGEVIEPEDGLVWRWERRR